VACFCLVGDALAKTTECIVFLKEDNSSLWDESVSDYLKKQIEAPILLVIKLRFIHPSYSCEVMLSSLNLPIHYP
jgi:hypothetical protein